MQFIGFLIHKIPALLSYDMLAIISFCFGLALFLSSCSEIKYEILQKFLVIRSDEVPQAFFREHRLKVRCLHGLQKMLCLLDWSGLVSARLFYSLIGPVLSLSFPFIEPLLLFLE